MNAKKPEEEFTEQETARRRDELAKRVLDMPPRPLKPKSEDGTKASPPEKRERSAKEIG
ncbi:MAG: hypothetical protein WA231_00330 [Methylocella sp.]